MYRHRTQASDSHDSNSNSTSSNNQQSNPTRSRSRIKSRQILSNQSEKEEEEYLLNPTSYSSNSNSNSNSNSSNSRRNSSDEYEAELDPFARPIRKLKSTLDDKSNNAKRKRVLLFFIFFTLITISFISFRHFPTFNSSNNFNDLNSLNSTANKDEKTKGQPLSSSEMYIENLLGTPLPDGIHLTPQEIENQSDLSSLPIQFHRDPLPLKKFEKPEKSKRRKILDIELLKPIWNREDENCVEDWISKGEICKELKINFDSKQMESNLNLDLNSEQQKQGIEIWKNRKLDLVWTWVNGSDSRHKVSRRMYSGKPFGRWADDKNDFDFFKEKRLVEEIKKEKEKSEKEREKKKEKEKRNFNFNFLDKRANNPNKIPPRPQKFTPDNSDERFRESDELRFSMRSSVKHLGSGLGTMHVISPDFPAAKELQDEFFKIKLKIDWIDGKFVEVAGLDKENEVNHRRIETSAGGRLKIRAPLKTPEFQFPSELSLNESSDHFLTKEGKLRLGQIPTWLNVSKTDLVFTGERSNLEENQSKILPKVRFHHDWNLFNHNFLKEPKELGNELSESNEILKWKKEVLPTFNSMAIESMIGDSIKGLSEDFISTNDDFFFGKDLRISDFNSPFYGLIFHFQSDLLVGSTKPGSIQASIGSGEWPGLHDSNYLLNQRFGKKKRSYVSHFQRIFNLPLLLEMKSIWSKEIFKSSISRWRNEESRDLIQHFLFSHFVIERHREALIWSFLIGRIDEDGDGKLNAFEFDSFLNLIGLNEKSMKFWKDSLNNPHDNPIPNLKIPIRLPMRETILPSKISSNLLSVGYPDLTETTVKFSSNDGYPFIRLNPLVQLNPPTKSAGYGETRIKGGPGFEPYPNFIPNEKTKYRFGEDLEMQDPLDRPNPNGIKALKDQIKNDEKESSKNQKEKSVEIQSKPLHSSTNIKGSESFKKAACTIDLEECLLREFKRDQLASTQDIFKKFAFEKRECGDCLILQGIRKSGKLGLDFFLPLQDQKFPTSYSSSDDRILEPQPPHLPLTKSSGTSISEEKDDDGEEIEIPDFSLKAISSATGWEDKSIREFSRRLILRYTYSIGELPIRFIPLQTPVEAVNGLSEIQKDSPALYCLNDDMGNRVDQSFMKFIMRKFLIKKYPQPLDFELDDLQHDVFL